MLQADSEAYVMGADGEPTRTVAPPPDAYTILSLAERWHVPPWVVEDGPAYWVCQALEMYAIEAKVRRETQGHG